MGFCMGASGTRRSGWGQSASAQSNYEDPDRTETEYSDDDDEEMPANSKLQLINQSFKPSNLNPEILETQGLDPRILPKKR